MEPQELQQKRWIVGLLSLLFLAGAGTFWLYDESRIAIIGALLRIGIMLGAFWFAIPVMIRYPGILRRLPWFLVLGCVLLVAFIKQFLLLIPLFIALALLTMFTGRKPRQ